MLNINQSWEVIFFVFDLRQIIFKEYAWANYFGVYLGYKRFNYMLKGKMRILLTI